MKYTVVQDIKSETKVGKSMFLYDFFFLLTYGAVSFMLANMVHSTLKIPFYVFSGCCAVFLTMKSSWNKKRRNWESIFLYLRKDREVYHPLPNVSVATERQKQKKEGDGYEEK